MTDIATDFVIGSSPIPRDETPDVEPDGYADSTPGPFIDLYPDSTLEAPYGRKPNGEPYKRHHSGRAPKDGSVNARMPGKQAETAAALLARLNLLFGMSLGLAGMPRAQNELVKNNDTFEVMARDALAADPALCRKILSAGATSGKAGLVMAYTMLGVSIAPTIRDEYRENHPREIEE
jgi:hypothetical protein